MMDGLWISLSFRNPQLFHGALGFRVLVVYGFSVGFSHFGQNGGFRVIFVLKLFCLFFFFGLGWMVHGFPNLGGIRVFLEGLTILEKIAIFVLFFAFDCLDNFLD